MNWGKGLRSVMLKAGLAALLALLAGCSECDTDADCGSGQVCEVVSRAAPEEIQTQCVAGCHEDSQCGAGERCERVECVTTPCPGLCVTDGDACVDDTDCSAGTVCELSTGCSSPTQCVPGCHEDDQCGAGQSCRILQCFTCPCAGVCEPSELGCASDADCSSGFVCELSTGCQAPSQCVPGCHADDECPAGARCEQPQCFTCPCPGSCSR